MLNLFVDGVSIERLKPWRWSKRIVFYLTLIAGIDYMERTLIPAIEQTSDKCSPEADWEGEEWRDHQHAPRQWRHQLLRYVQSNLNLSLWDHSGVMQCVRWKPPSQALCTVHRAYCNSFMGCFSDFTWPCWVGPVICTQCCGVFFWFDLWPRYLQWSWGWMRMTPPVRAPPWGCTRNTLRPPSWRTLSATTRGRAPSSSDRTPSPSTWRR